MSAQTIKNKYDLLNYKDERDIQNTISHFLSQEKFGKIYEENFYDVSSPLQKHQYILIDDFLEYVEILNRSLFNGQYKEQKDQIIKIIKDDFLSKFDAASSNLGVYNLIFGTDTRTITLTKSNGIKDNLVSYQVVDVNYKTDCRNNKLTIIKEKVIKVNKHSQETQRPDFAVYLNGIPFIAIEVKNPLSSHGVYEAFNDYKKKSTYHKFISCLCTDGVNAGLSSNPLAFGLDSWKNYGSHSGKFSEHNSGFYDFAEEILFKIKNFVFYFQNGLFPVGRHLGNLRVQQYFVMKKSFNLVDSSEDIFREVVKHPPRSGKTIAIRSIIKMLTSLYPNRFKKIFIQAPDLTIKGQFEKDFISFDFGNGFSTKIIERRRKTDNDGDEYYSYEEAISDPRKGIYIMNMQKLSDDFDDIQNDSKDILVFIDEVHTHQLGENAKIRDINFPNASYITFTATTRKKIINNKLVDHTLTEYSTSNQYLDELFNNDAKNLDMVVPVVYEKAKYNVVLNDDNAEDFSDYVNDKFLDLLQDDGRFSGARDKIEERVISFIQQKLEKESEIILERDKVISILKNSKNSALYKEAVNYRIKLYEEKSKSLSDTMKTELLDQIKIHNIPQVLDYLTLDMKRKIEENYSHVDLNTQKRTPYFKAKAFLVAPSQRVANEMAKYIKEQSSGTNIINGLKFGLDYSEAKHEERFTDTFNVIKYGSSIKDDFDSPELDSTDILIIVGKYLMGYDNKRLISVYCYTTISEPSRIFQLYTRPATSFKDKKLGFFVDLGFDGQNYDTYKRALHWYEGSAESNVLFLEEEEIENQRKNLANYITKLLGILSISGEDFLKSEKERSLFIQNINEDQQQSIFNICKAIHGSLKNLISQRYYRDFLPYILKINKALFGMLSYLKANKKDVVFSRKDIEILYYEFMEVLKLENVDDIMEIEICDEAFIKNQAHIPSKESLISSQLHSIKSLLSVNKGFVPSSIFDKLKRMADEIEADNEWNTETQKKTNDLLIETKKETDNIKELIKIDFEGSPEWFIAHKVIKNYLVIQNIEFVDSDIFKSFTKPIAEVIKTQILHNSKGDRLSKDNFMIEKVRESFGDSAVFHFQIQDIDHDFIQRIYRAIAIDEKKEEGNQLSEQLITSVYMKRNEYY